jgi:hypothetical protein
MSSFREFLAARGSIMDPRPTLVIIIIVADEGLCSSGDFIAFGDFDSQLKAFIVLDGTRRLRRHASRGIRCHAGLAT